MRKTYVLGLSLLLGCFALLVVGEMSVAQVKKGKTRAMLTKHLMAGLVKPHCGDIKKGLDAGPSSEKDWAAMEMHAALLNEASYILMDDDRCPDGTWAQAASKTLRDGSAAVLEAAAAKDAKAAKAAFGRMTKSCGACHKAHKKK